ncbi:MAG: bifunctional histidine phosphatase family protein/GNAT family N-acetyltransferase [Defluviitaleaceae bacterium]|nr:bifunctional histidine phosphatase family protein/GNAT family N-acetyltransferase [Defluviitaleaceae bacterium]MCL2263128.1 bifunctional histidine phosphatase family protein/GNAT family N-acetyltransferase [Defluviitaleaceae bacterium]
MKICIMRHGETDWNVQGRWQGREDIPLNENGRQQARSAGFALKNGAIKWDAIFTSPLKRAKETGKIIAEILGITEIYENEDLTEREFGVVAGMLPAEREAHFAAGNYEGMESWEDLHDRVHGAVLNSANKLFPKNILIISHGGAIKSIMNKLINEEIGFLKNTCTSLLSFENKKLEVVFHNRPLENITIRKAKPDDAEVLMDLYLNHLKSDLSETPQDMHLWREKIARLEPDPMYHLFVSEVNGRVVSSVTLVAIENLTRNLRPYALIENVVTHADFRNKGHAAALMQQAVQTATALNCYKIILLTSAKEDSTLRFYENCGFNRDDKTGFIKWIGVTP